MRSYKTFIQQIQVNTYFFSALPYGGGAAVLKGGTNIRSNLQIFQNHLHLPNNHSNYIIVTLDLRYKLLKHSFDFFHEQVTPLLFFEFSFVFLSFLSLS